MRPPGHAERNSERLAILEEQRADLAACLDALVARDPCRQPGVSSFTARLKMYNDPSLNPAIYRKLRPASPANLPVTLAH